MKLDRTFTAELRQLRGGGTRQETLQMMQALTRARNDLSTPYVRKTFQDALRRNGRAAVAVCVAATLDARRMRLEGWEWPWAHAVLEEIPLRPDRVLALQIDDGIHPTAVCDYAADLIRCTTEEAFA